MSNHNKKFNILLFWFNDDWGQFGRAYERVAENLSKLPEIGQVVCMFPPEPSSENNKDTLKVRVVSDKLTIIKQTRRDLLRVDAHLSRLRSRFNKAFRLYTLKKKLRQLGFRKDNTVLWLFPPHPYLEYVLENVPHCHVVSHVIDDFTKFDPNHPLYAYAKDQYPKLAKWSDSIITTSKANQDHFSQLTDSCHMFWPAVDKSFLGQPQPLPHRSTGAAPRLGYVGWIMDRTDLELIEYVARKRPDWHIILAGPQYPDDYLEQSNLLSLANVEYIGALPQEDVPEFLWSLDVCLIPHRDNEYSRSMGPLKLYQYLASGRPIVSTNIASLDHVNEQILIATDQNEFVHHIETALQNDTIEQSAKRINVAQQNVWEVRIREMFGAILKDA